MTFRQNATDADNHIKTNLGATYVQDQIEINRYLQVVTGVRFDYFDLQFHNNRNSQELRRIDRLVSPRAGVIVKPINATVGLCELWRRLPAELRRSVFTTDDHHATSQTREVHELRIRRQVGHPSQFVVHDSALPAGSDQHESD